MSKHQVWIQTTTGEERVSSSLQLSDHTTEGNQGRDLEVRTVTEAMEGDAYWLAVMACLAFFLTASRTTITGVTLPSVGWALSHQSNQAILVGDVFSVELPFSQILLACVKLKK